MKEKMHRNKNKNESKQKNKRGSHQEIWDVAVIGGGPSGMMAAGRAAELDEKVILIEKNSTLGKKLLLTGGGRCNVTNAEFDTRKLLEKFGKGGQFLFSTFAQHAVRDSIDFFNKRGMPTKIEAESRVFPTSDSARSVLDILTSYLKEGGVTTMTGTTVKNIDTTKSTDTTKGANPITLTLKDGSMISARSLIIATGGKAYPETGSTGDGFVWLKKLGHNILEPDSSLVPIKIKDHWTHELQGVALPEIKISIFQGRKRLESKKGKILFTHFGVSGPTILNMSKRVSELLQNGEKNGGGEVILSLDLLPKFDYSSLNEKLLWLFKKNSNKKIRNALTELIPSALVPVVIEIAKLDPDWPAHDITREERIALMKLLKDIPMRVGGLLGLEDSIVSSGGVDLSEVDSKTMRSRLLKNLYITGDALNIDRPSGGYSLQICWSTGFVAGTNAAADATSSVAA